MFLPCRAKRAFEDVVDQIQSAILTGQLKDGERLPSERALTEKFQAGRLTIREALRTLETKGLVKIRKGSSGGAFVAVGNRENVASIIVDNLTVGGLTHDNLNEARLALECAVVRSAIKRADPSSMALIEEDVNESRIISDQDTPSMILSKMIRFHLLLADASHNPLFIVFIRALMEWAKRKLSNYSPTADHIRYSYRAHKGIFEAVRDKNVPLAELLMKRHIERMGNFVRNPGSEGWKTFGSRPKATEGFHPTPPKSETRPKSGKIPRNRRVSKGISYNA
jgi:GntR family transcriptional regulator, transcriptional repressor for pyruvate dehydrogenase complex